MNPPPVRLLGFENEPAVGELLAQFQVFDDYRSGLPLHLHQILARQYPTLELLRALPCDLGGMQQPDTSVMKVQEFKFPLELRLTVRVGHLRHELDVRLVLHGQSLDTVPKVTSDLSVHSQRPLPSE